MKIFADLHIHSKYSRAVSQEMLIPKIWEWAKRKGINLITTGDWTHPLWMREIKTNLVDNGSGFLKLRNTDNTAQKEGPAFLLTTEISSIYSQRGRLRRIHNLIWSPSIETAEKINKELLARGANLMSDGRPIVGLTSMQIAELVLNADHNALLIPAHIWTPWFSMYGSESGFDSINECFGGFAKHIYGIETGLSSDPAMNWRIAELDNRAILSSSDSHSGPKLGREITVFDLSEMTYDAVKEAIKNTGQPDSINKIMYTVEFHPEEGKYHFTGHRNCQIRQSPEETKARGTTCPVCGRKLTVGVMHRVEQLAKRSEESLKLVKKNFADTAAIGVYSSTFPNRPPYTMLVPLLEVIAEVNNGQPTNKGIQSEYFKMTDLLGSEFEILLYTDLDKIAKTSGEKMAQAISMVREGKVSIDPGYDGVFGKVKIWNEEKTSISEKPKEQMSLF